MSRVGRNPVKVPPSVTVSIEPMPSELLFPFRPFSKKREKYALRNRPSYDSFAAFGQPTRIRVEGPLGAKVACSPVTRQQVGTSAGGPTPPRGHSETIA